MPMQKTGKLKQITDLSRKMQALGSYPEIFSSFSEGMKRIFPGVGMMLLEYHPSDQHFAGFFPSGGTFVVVPGRYPISRFQFLPPGSPVPFQWPESPPEPAQNALRSLFEKQHRLEALFQYREKVYALVEMLFPEEVLALEGLQQTLELLVDQVSLACCRVDLESRLEEMDRSFSDFFGGKLDRELQQELTQEERPSSLEQTSFSHELFRRIFDHSPAGLELFDKEGKLLLANPAVVETFGVEKASVLSGFRLFQDPNLPPHELEKLKRGKTIHLEIPFDFEKVHALQLYPTRKHGVIFLDAIITPLFWAGEIHGFLAQLVDVTPRVRAENKIRENERRWKFALESSQFGLWDWNVQSNEVFFSDTWKRMLGFEPHEIQADLSEWEKRVHPDDLAETMRKVQEHLEGKTPFYESIHRMQAKDGEWLWIQDRGSVIERDEEGNPLRCIGTHTDVSGKMEDQKRLALLSEMVEQASDAIIHCDANGTMLYVNPAAVNLFGWVPSELVGKKMVMLNGEEDPDAFEQKVVATLAETGCFSGEMCFKRKDGTTFFGVARISPMKKPDGGVIGYVNNIRDNTSIRATRQELKLAKEKAEEASQAKTQFLANMSHELRTPLNGVLGLAELALMNDPPANLRNYLENIQHSGQDLLNIVGSILDFSSIEFGELQLHPEPFSLLEMLEDIARAFRAGAFQKNLDFYFHVEPKVPERIVGDQTRIRQILVNLLNNALKFTSTGKIHFTVSRGEGVPLENTQWTNFRVEDTGIGIPPSKVELIFEGFQQADLSTTRAYGGTGLGLSISRRLTQMMGGTLQVQSREGKGSIFSLHIPLRVEAVGAKTKDAHAQERPASHQPPPKKALIVEDNPINRMIAANMLQKLGFETIAVADGEDAVRLAQETSFDLVFMDIHMPVMDGVEATKIIRHSEPSKSKNAKIVALTADALEGDREKYLGMEMDEYVAKPFKFIQIQQVVTKLFPGFLGT